MRGHEKSDETAIGEPFFVGPSKWLLHTPRAHYFLKRLPPSGGGLPVALVDPDRGPLMAPTIAEIERTRRALPEPDRVELFFVSHGDPLGLEGQKGPFVHIDTPVPNVVLKTDQVA